MSRRTIRLFGLAILSIETTEDDDSGAAPGDVTTSQHQAGFVRDDLPTYHLGDVE